MSDYVSCPACHGRGLLPLEDAQRINVHDLVIADERAAERQQADADRQRILLEARMRAAQHSQAKLDALVFGPPVREL